MHGHIFTETPRPLSDVFPLARWSDQGTSSNAVSWLPILRLPVLIQAVARSRRISLPTKPIPVLTRVLNEFQLDET